MKQTLFVFVLFFNFQHNVFGQTIVYDGCRSPIQTGAFPFTLMQSGVTNDGGTIRNTYISSVPGTTCSGGSNCVHRIMWNVVLDRWEIQLSLNGGGVYEDPLYTSTVASLPNPPGLVFGAWVDNAPFSQCGNLAQLSGSGLQDGILPVELTGFHAKRLNSNNVQLNWETATEINNLGFYIERMLETDGEFETISYQEGAGNSSRIKTYELIDENSYVGISYYRLKQVDFDGEVSFSEIKAVSGIRTNNNSGITVSVYPTPVLNELRIRLNQLPEEVKSAKIEIRNVNGTLLKDFTAETESYKVLKMEVADLIPTLYILSIELDNGQLLTNKFVKQ